MMYTGGFDAETTGFDATTGDRFVEICLSLYDPVTGVLVKSMAPRINPERLIPTSATDVHGITWADVMGCPNFEYYAPDVRAWLDLCSTLVIHNVGFDAPFLRAELKRCRCADDLPPTIDTMQRWATFDGKSPTLAELCKALNVEFDPTKAHGASYDTGKMMEAYFKGVKRGFFLSYSIPEIKVAA